MDCRSHQAVTPKTHSIPSQETSPAESVRAATFGFGLDNLRTPGSSRAIVCTLVAAVILSSSATVVAQGPASPSAPLPDFKLVRLAVANYFASLEDYRPGDLISREQVSGALEHVRQAGWDVALGDEIVDKALAPDSFIVKELSTPAGRTFMRKIGRHAGAYARLDQLSTISHGKSVVSELVRKPGGDELIEYLVTTRGGRKLGRMMAGTQQGVDLNQPTGRIYTANELMTEIQQAYAAALRSH